MFTLTPFEFPFLDVFQLSFFFFVRNIFLVDNRQEYDVREERRRELEFLEKVWQINLSCYLSSPVNDSHLIAPHFQGGNPLDFKFGNAASVSVQSTSLTDQHPEQIVTR